MGASPEHAQADAARLVGLLGLDELLDWLSTVALDDGDVSERVNRVTRALVAPEDSGASAAARRWLASALDGIRYIVFNVPAHLAKQHQRIFVAVIRPLDDANDYAWRAEEPEEADAELCAVHVLGADTTPKAVSDRLAKEWAKGWKEYTELTERLARRGVLTWNQFLLHGATRPRPLGLSWTADEAEDYYVRADNALLGKLGISLVDRTRDRHMALSTLSLREEGWPLLDEAVLRHWTAQQPLQSVDVTATTACSIYHLMRSYARWGGGAFLSIPVPITGGLHKYASAVLSICSERPVAKGALALWTLIATAVFVRASSGELVTQFDLREAERDAARRQGEAWAHEVKNYTGPVIRLLARVARDCPNRHPNIDWALQGSRILNAASYAIQLGIGQRYRRDIATTGLRRLPRPTAAGIVEAVLQYLLNYHDASTGDQLVLEWCPKWPPENCIRQLSNLLSARECAANRDVDWEVLTRAEVVWTVALLRELIQNVRVNHPVAGDVKVRVSYRLDVQGDDLILELEQKQREMTVEEGPEEPPGIRHANELFGRASGIGLGEIEILRCQVDEPEAQAASLSGGVGGWAGKTVTYRARARLALDAEE